MKLNNTLPGLYFAGAWLNNIGCVHPSFCSGYYRKVRHFIQNAVNNTSGQEAYGKIRAEAAFQAIHTFLLKMNGLDSLEDEFAFTLRLYVFGLVEVFERHVIDDNAMPDERFVELCEECMPEKLKPYLLK